MAWVGVITNNGSELMRDWVSGKVLNMTTAPAGTGTYSEATLMSQTSLKSQKATATIASVRRIDAGLKVKLELRSGSEAFTLNQFGLYAKLDDGTPTMIALFQTTEGIYIPSHDEAPDYDYAFYMVLAISNIGDFTFTIDESTVVTLSSLSETVNKQKIVEIPVDGWETIQTDDDEYYVQEIEVIGMKSNMNPSYELEPTAVSASTLETVRQEKFSYGYIGDIITDTDKIIVYCETDVPTVTFKIRLTNFSEKEDANGPLL